jgi:hypothetical protein
MDIVSSVLITTAAGSSVLKVRGTVKMAGTWACVAAPMDDSVVVLARRKCAHLWKFCHSYGSSY